MYNSQIKTLIYGIGMSEGISNREMKKQWFHLSKSTRREIVRGWKDEGLLEGVVKIEKELKEKKTIIEIIE